MVKDSRNIVNNLIVEFVTALDEEILALKNGKGGSITKVFNGKLIRQVPNGFIYLFHLENFLATLDEAPAEIEIAGRTYSAQILLTQGLEVEIVIENYCGDFIAEGKLISNLWYLLEILKNKYIESEDSVTKFKISDALFTQNISAFPQNSTILKPKYSLSGTPPNIAQLNGIDCSLNKPLTVIWGPPGTGKTTTIAKAIEAHLNAGRKVLLVSHANNAVDQAMLDVAEQLKTTSYYNNGELVRLGTPTDPVIYNEIEEKYPLVLMDQVAAMLGSTLVAEKNKLSEGKTVIEYQIYKLNEANNLLKSFETLKATHQNTINALQEFNLKHESVGELIRVANNQQSAYQTRLIESNKSGVIKRLLKGLNPVQIQKQIDKNSILLDSYRRQESELTIKLEEFNNRLLIEDGDIPRIESETKTLFTKIGITSISELINKYEVYEKELLKIQTRIGEIDKELDELQQSILGKARLVATTLTKTFIDKKFELLNFDVLILDEASMAPLPYVYWAASKITSNITIVGDFLQLPPICISSGSMSQKWLANSIFDVLEITNPGEALSNPIVTLLDTQYRMLPEIAEIPKNFFYGGNLKHGPQKKTKEDDDHISKNPLVLITTDNMNPWCSRLSTGGRFNLYNALVAATLAKKIIEKGFKGTIGIVTPYSAQAKLINKIAKDWRISEHTHISTIHRFQGGEEQIIIFDTVEATGTYIAPMLDGTKNGSNADLLLNVAITRAKSKFYLIGHLSHLYSGLNENSSLSSLLKYLEKYGEIRSSDEFVDNYLVSDFEEFTKSPKLSESEKNKGSLYTDNNFWSQFNEDLNSIENRIIILSPFLSVKRSDQFMNRFQSLIAKGVEVTIYTRPKNQQSGEMVNQSDTVIEHLSNIGVKVIERSKMHQKVAIIDNKISWAGSLNILSHRDSGEQMHRFEGSDTILEIIKNLELDKSDGAGNYSDKICPLCSKHLVYRTSRFGKFLGCSDYPKCKFIEKGAQRFTTRGKYSKSR